MTNIEHCLLIIVVTKYALCPGILHRAFQVIATKKSVNLACKGRVVTVNDPMTQRNLAGLMTSSILMSQTQLDPMTQLTQVKFNDPCHAPIGAM